MTRAYTWAAALLVRLLVRFCTSRGRYVDYVHAGRVYMRRYVISGFMTGDAPAAGWRARLPNLYLHHIQASDLDPSLHDHPWPWAVSLVLLGGYEEERLVLPTTRPSFGRTWLSYFKRWGFVEPRDVRREWFRAPVVNVLSGRTFHRIAGLAEGAGHGPGNKGPLRALMVPTDHSTSPPRHGVGCTGRCTGTWTLFLAGPRASGKPWGYIVDGRGYVPQQTRHAELDACEVRPVRS